MVLETPPNLLGLFCSFSVPFDLVQVMLSLVQVDVVLESCSWLDREVILSSFYSI
jgi:hypothetical protein